MSKTVLTSVFHKSLITFVIHLPFCALLYPPIEVGKYFELQCLESGAQSFAILDEIMLLCTLSS